MIHHKLFGQPKFWNMKYRFFLLVLSLTLMSLVSCSNKEKVYKVLIETEFGDIKVELFNSTPLHRDNFIKLVKEEYYQDLLFHRVIKNFMIQGGDPFSSDPETMRMVGTGGPGYTIPAEIGALHYRGALAAARMGGPTNPNKESSGSQFYIVQGKQPLQETELLRASEFHGLGYTEDEKMEYLQKGGYPMLDNNYTVFGRVISGMEVVDSIANVSVNQMDRPLNEITMKLRVTKR